jgi:hypothetical protein
VLGSVLGAENLHEQSADTGPMLSGMPTLPHRVAVLTPRPKPIEVAKR